MPHMTRLLGVQPTQIREMTYEEWLVYRADLERLLREVRRAT